MNEDMVNKDLSAQQNAKNLLKIPKMDMKRLSEWESVSVRPESAKQENNS